ncbi:MAG: TAT-variant-translocated molybdopterin oxidoreductase [Bacteroidia bacterium]|nr:TAT-variant-translocated molybdopterin oxidoreductase [Bacteroidia bacterium]
MSTPKYWRGLDELNQTPEFLASVEKEFPTDKPMDEVLAETSDESMNVTANRRDFLKFLGFGVTAATLTACAEGPVKKAIPYVTRPDDIPDEVNPGVANYYASTAPSGNPILVKTREGRPIKLEGNPDSSVNKGGLSALDQATVLDLYDKDRGRGPMKAGNLTDWGLLDSEVADKLNKLKGTDYQVRVVSSTVMSPTTQAIIDGFLAQFPGSGKHVQYDAVSVSALSKVHEKGFGKRAIPSFHFNKAMTIVGFNCDFLGTWINPVGFAADYTVHRDPDGKMSRHYQFESLMTITGAKADLRFPINPSSEGLALLNLYNKVAAKLGKPSVPGVKAFDVAMNGIEAAASDLVKNAGKSIVASGTNNVAIQTVVAAINDMLGNYGSTLDIVNASHLAKGDDEAMAELVSDLKGGKVKAVLFLDANPVYNSTLGAELKEALKNADLTLSFAWKGDETSESCEYVATSSHYLESWGDVQQSDTHLSLMQPTIHPIYDTRQAEDSLLKWSGSSESYVDYLKTYWENNAFPKQTEYTSFRKFWNESLRKGLFALAPSTGTATMSLTAEDVMTEADKLKAMANGAGSDFEVVFFEKVGIGNGDQANNPWLQELPDPISRVSWDNYVSVPYSYAQENGLKNEDVLAVTVGGTTMNLPVYIQPGQAANTLAIALGYGRTKGGVVADKVNGEKVNGKNVGGGNVYPLTEMKDGAVSYMRTGATASKLGFTYPLALVQTFNTLYDPAKGKGIFKDDYDRTEEIVDETHLAAYTGSEYKERVAEREARKQHLVSLWDAHFEDPETARNIHWKMAIDLNKCTGCGACVVACNAENNVPVVGKEEVRTRREMHWMRIDRYYRGNPNDPDVVFQPMLCQHCDNAPCETVCPVLATIHSNEGLNQMTYNRCIGTRYCANNCPYKVRRFNWFNYYNDNQFKDFYTHSKLGRLVLNPDVTVRYRGVMEKCSFCVQRLQDAKLRAKVNAKSTFAKPEDGDVQVACQQSCPTGAIVFGDANDRESEIYKALRHQRSYVALEEVKTLPSVQYQALVRNRTNGEADAREEAFNEWRKETYGPGYEVPTEA